MKATAAFGSAPVTVPVASVTLVLSGDEAAELVSVLYTAASNSEDAHNFHTSDQLRALRGVLQGALVSHSTASLAGIALLSETVRDFITSSQKIKAIKELRTITGCGLREAKDAVDAVDSIINPPF